MMEAAETGFGATDLHRNGEEKRKEMRVSLIVLGAISAMLFMPLQASAFYNPELGRWESRDPIGEVGGVGLFAFVGNHPATSVDILGDVEAKSEATTERDPRDRMSGPEQSSGDRNYIAAFYTQLATAGNGSDYPDNGICNSGTPLPSHVRGWMRDSGCKKYLVRCELSVTARVWRNAAPAGTTSPTATFAATPPGATLKGHVLGYPISLLSGAPAADASGGILLSWLVHIGNYSDIITLSGTWKEVYFVQNNISAGSLAGNTRLNPGFSETMVIDCSFTEQ